MARGSLLLSRLIADGAGAELPDARAVELRGPGPRHQRDTRVCPRPAVDRAAFRDHAADRLRTVLAASRVPPRARTVALPCGASFGIIDGLDRGRADAFPRDHHPAQLYGNADAGDRFPGIRDPGLRADPLRLLDLQPRQCRDGL